MLAIVYGEKDEARNIALVLTEENIKRMADGDPITIQIGEYVPGVDLELTIGSISEGVVAMSAPELIAHISRGYKVLPDDGHAPISITKGKQN